MMSGIFLFITFTFCKKEEENYRGVLSSSATLCVLKHSFRWDSNNRK